MCCALRRNESALRLLIRAKCHCEVSEVTCARAIYILFRPVRLQTAPFSSKSFMCFCVSAINCDLVQYLWSHAPRFGWRAAIKRDSEQALPTAPAQRKSEEDDALGLVPGGASSVQTLRNNTAGRELENLKFMLPLSKGQIWRIRWSLFHCGWKYYFHLD
jgi:hypothetical protein